MKKKRFWQLHGASIFLVGSVLAGMAWGETMEIATYYPAGVSSQFDRLHAKRATIGTPYEPTSVPDGSVPDGNLLVSGNVGIGTPSPHGRLEVDDSSKTTASGNANVFVLTTDGQAADVGGSLSLGGNIASSSSPTPFGYIWGRKENSTANNQNGYLAFGTRNNGTGAAEWMRITSAGNVGIGTVAPIRNLQVMGTGNVIAEVDGTDAAWLQLYASKSPANSKLYDIISNNGYLLFRALNDDGSIKDGWPQGDRMVIAPNGNIGVGYYTQAHVPGRALVVSGAAGLGDGRGLIEVWASLGGQKSIFEQVAGTTYMGNLGWNNWTWEAGKDLQLLAGNGIYAMTILGANGYVGINNTTPIAALDVNGNILTRGARTYLAGVDAYPGWHWMMAGGTDENYFRALGFNPWALPIRMVAVGPQWSLNLMGSRTYISGVDAQRTHWIMCGGTTEGIFNALGFNPFPPRVVAIGPGWTFVNPSDLRLKKDIVTIPNALEKVSAIRGVTFRWADPALGSDVRMGVIGQEVEKVFPEAVNTDSKGMKSVAYSELMAPLIEAVKELKAQNEQLRKRLEDLERQRKNEILR